MKQFIQFFVRSFAQKTMQAERSSVVQLTSNVDKKSNDLFKDDSDLGYC